MSAIAGIQGIVGILDWLRQNGLQEEANKINDRIQQQGGQAIQSYGQSASGYLNRAGDQSVAGYRNLASDFYDPGNQSISIKSQADAENAMRNGASLADIQRAMATGQPITIKRSIAQDVLDKAESSNRDLADAYKRRSSELAAGLDSYGEVAKRDIDQQYKNSGGSILQDLASRGLTGGGVEGSLRLGNEKQRIESRARLDENISKMRSDLNERTTGDYLNEYGRGLTQLTGLREGQRVDQGNARAAALQAGERDIGRRTGFASDYLNTGLNWLKGGQAQGPGYSSIGSAINPAIQSYLTQQQIAAANKQPSMNWADYASLGLAGSAGLGIATGQPASYIAGDLYGAGLFGRYGNYR